MRSNASSAEAANYRHERAAAIRMLGFGLFAVILVLVGMERVEETGVELQPANLVLPALFAGLMIGMGVCTWPRKSAGCGTPTGEA